MKTDDNLRDQNGVVVCLRDMGNGTSRLFFDDVKADQVVNPIKWTQDCFFTFSLELSNVAVDSMKLSDRQLQDVGIAVVTRLLALNGRTREI